MSDKMMVFLLLVLSIQQAKTCNKKMKRVSHIPRRTDLEDCTSIFTNRIASFESGLHPGHWMLPSVRGYRPILSSSSVPTANVKTDKTYQWFLHGCGVGKVCLEANREGWEEYYIYHSSTRYNLYSQLDTDWYGEALVKDTNFHDGSNEKNQIEIWCTSCTPESDDLTYSDCQLHANGGEREMLGSFDPTHNGWARISRGSRGSDDMLKWRILSPRTRQYWETTVATDNCDGQKDLPAAYTVTSSITRTTSTTQTTTISEKISFGREADKVLKLLGGEAGITQTWLSSWTRAAAEGSTLSLGGYPGKIISPGHKWVIKQLVGEVGYTKIKTLEHRSTDPECT